jgi:PKD repeat protein
MYVSGSLTTLPMVMSIDNLTAAPVFDGPVPNQAPTALFSSAASDLSVSLNGSGSSDPDGSVVSWAWDFGDGSQGSGATPQHTYAAAGTYTVTLTVTDDDGATGTLSVEVTVTAAPGPAANFASDTFSRVVTNGLGTAETGGAWTLQGPASNFSVTGSVGRLSAAAAGVIRGAFLDSAKATDTDLNVSFSLSQAQTGGGTYVSVLGRRVSPGNDYAVKTRFLPDGSVQAQLVRSIGGAETVLQNINALPGLTYSPGEMLQVRFQAEGTGTTVLKAKIWKDGQPEPAVWTLERSDSTAALQAPGGVGVLMYVSGSLTTLPMVMSIDNLTAAPIGAP